MERRTNGQRKVRKENDWIKNGGGLEDCCNVERGGALEKVQDLGKEKSGAGKKRKKDMKREWRRLEDCCDGGVKGWRGERGRRWRCRIWQSRRVDEKRNERKDWILEWRRVRDCS